MTGQGEKRVRRERGGRSAGAVGGGHLDNLHVPFFRSNEEAGVAFKVGGEEEVAPAGLGQRLPSPPPHHTTHGTRNTLMPHQFTLQRHTTITFLTCM